MYSYPGFRQSVYMATTNSPEGRPFDLFLRATHDLFRHELGHPVTSRIVSTVVKIHSVFIGIVVVYFIVMGDYTEKSFTTMLFANIVACYGTLQIGMMEYEELEDVAAEINAS